MVSHMRDFMNKFLLLCLMLTPLLCSAERVERYIGELYENRQPRGLVAATVRPATDGYDFAATSLQLGEDGEHSVQTLYYKVNAAEKSAVVTNEEGDVVGHATFVGDAGSWSEIITTFDGSRIHEWITPEKRRVVEQITSNGTIYCVNLYPVNHAMQDFIENH